MAWLCAASLASAQLRNGHEQITEKSYGSFLQYKSRINSKEILSKNKDLVNAMKQKWDLKNVLVADAADGYWYFVLEAKGKKGVKLYGAADQDGRLIVEPKYQRCHYQLPLKTGVDQITVDITNHDYSTIEGQFNLWHGPTDASFLVMSVDETGNNYQWSIIGMDGVRKVQLPSNASATPYHGYLFFGIDKISFHWDGARQCLFAYNENKPLNLSIYTTDGKPVVPDGETCFYIYNYEDGCNEVKYSIADANKLQRMGVKVLGRDGRDIPPYFNHMKYDDKNKRWMVRTQFLEPHEPYVPGRYTGISYHNAGEELFYQAEYKKYLGKYDEALKMYSKVTDFYKDNGEYPVSDVSRPWHLLYYIYASERIADCHASPARTVTESFEKLDGTYRLYYDKRDKIPGMFVDAYGLVENVQKMLDIFLKVDSLKVYEKASSAIRKKTDEDLKLYADYYNRVNTALSDLDTRIARYEQQQAALQREAEDRQREADRQAGAMIFNNVFSNMMTGLNGGGGSTSGNRTTTSNRASTSSRSTSSGSSSSYSSGGGSQSSGSSTTAPRKSRCIVCAGCGRCKNCNGKGETIYLGTGKGMQRCGNCNGTGKCTPCNGTGYK